MICILNLYAYVSLYTYVMCIILLFPRMRGGRETCISTLHAAQHEFWGASKPARRWQRPWRTRQRSTSEPVAWVAGELRADRPSGFLPGPSLCPTGRILPKNSSRN